jgi:hypothetical protein
MFWPSALCARRLCQLVDELDDVCGKPDDAGTEAGERIEGCVEETTPGCRAPDARLQCLAVLGAAQLVFQRFVCCWRRAGGLR